MKLCKFEAKIPELENWKSQEVYTEVDGNNQQSFNSRWIISKKLGEGKSVSRARLCARG